MRVRIFLRRQGEANFRDLGSRDMGSVPPEDNLVIINVDGATVQAKVGRVRTFEPSPRDPEVYLEAV